MIPIRTFGRIADINASSTPIDIWDGGSLFNFLDKGTSLFVSSSNVLDVNISILVHGLNQNYEMQSKIVELNGQNQIEVEGLWLRVFFAMNGNHGQKFQGSIYVAEQTALVDGVPVDLLKTQAIVQPDLQISGNGFVTIPKGYTGYPEALQLSLVPKSSQAIQAKIGVFIRDRGRTFTGRAYFSLMTTGTSFIHVPIKRINAPLSSMSDFVIRLINISSDDAEIVANIEMVLKEKV